MGWIGKNNKNTPWIIFTYSLRFLVFFSSIRPFIIWLAIEINTLIFIPFLRKKTIFTHEAVVNYYIIQAISSIVLIFSIFNIITSEQIILLASCFLCLPIFLKLRAAPFHSWAVPIIDRIYVGFLIFLFLTAQKIIPFFLIFFSQPNLRSFFFIVLLVRSILGPILNFSQNNIKKIIFFSRISHIRWMLALIIISENLWLFYFFTYFAVIFLLTQRTKLSFTITKFFILWRKKKIFFFIILITLAGLPPTFGFYPKLIALFYFQTFNFFIIIFFFNY